MCHGHPFLREQSMKCDTGYGLPLPSGYWNHFKSGLKRIARESLVLSHLTIKKQRLMIKERGRNEPRLLHTAGYFSCHWVTTCCQFQRTFCTTYVLTALLCKNRGPFLEGPENVLHPENHSKISHLMITELFYSQKFPSCKTFWACTLLHF